VRILLVSSADVFPPDRGDKRRVHAIAKELSRRHEVILAAPRTAKPRMIDVDAEVVPLTARGGMFQLADPMVIPRLRRLVLAFRPHVIQVEAAWLGPQAIAASRGQGAVLYYDSHHIERDRVFAARRFSWPYPVLAEKVLLRWADSVLAVSEGDCAGMARLGMPAGKVQLIPNGYDESEFSPDDEARLQKRSELNASSEQFLILFLGELGYAPNKVGLSLLRREILPRIESSGLDYRLIVAGSGSDRGIGGMPTGRAQGLGWVPSMAEVINAADVVVAPLGRGGGSRLKIIESIACGTPVVANGWAADGLRRDICADYLTVTDDWDEFARAIADTPRRNLPRRRPDGFSDYYEWKQIVGRIRYPQPPSD
jgi:glycosyltransferase involved in cell wall biosynthesis